MGQQIQAHHVDRESLSWDEVLGIVNREGGLLICKGGQVVAGVCSPRDFDSIPELSKASQAQSTSEPASLDATSDAPKAIGQDSGSGTGTETTAVALDQALTPAGGTPLIQPEAGTTPTASTGEGEAANQGVGQVGGVT